MPSSSIATPSLRHGLPLASFAAALAAAIALASPAGAQDVPAATGVIKYDLEDTTIHPAHALHGMVSSANALATDVGVDVLRRGGNAVDAAVAVGFALAVTLPNAGNIG